MNTKTKISLVVLISIAIIVYVVFQSNMEAQTDYFNPNKISKNINKSNLKKDTVSTNQYKHQVQSIEEISDEVVDFNEQISKDLSIFGDKFAKTNAITQLQSKPRKDSSDVIEAIETYLEDIEGNQIEIDKLIVNCIGMDNNLADLEEHLTQSEGIITERSFNIYYFYQGLRTSKFCDKLGGRSDPFFVILKSARAGNMLSQLLLIDHLYIAINRNLINPQKYPLKYMNLRDEAVSYLQQLSAKGVTRATVKLSNIYSLSSPLVPANRILNYYYSFLAKKQEGIEPVYVRDLDSLYRGLTDKQKEIVDRMTDNL
ncbi:hypothetical protein MNBD_GAMMA01-2202 [hydrothermal vent metagenome]|uniref:Uncharacterized protein n=1 Tax=hydrothermal vent metagenome TaxID=652676 RepID=A0A3B0VCB9_9ZZZZ